MFKILIDTCVWLDLAKDHRQETLLTSLETLVKEKEVSLIMPRIVLTEFARNKARIIEDSKRSLSSTLKNARTLLWELEERQRGQSSTFDNRWDKTTGKDVQGN